MKRISVTLSIAIALFTFTGAAPSQAANSVTMSLTQTPGAGDPIVTIFGTTKPAKAGYKVTIQILLDGKWKSTRFITKTAKIGTWKVVATATGQEGKYTYRAALKSGKKVLYSKAKTITIKPAPSISENTAAVIEKIGPGGRIHGADISRWQHPNDQTIDFVKMHKAGLRFVMIKASDTRDDADALAVKYLAMDRHAAQAAGIYTGFYHYAVMPNSSSTQTYIDDAQAQAQKVIWRLAALGGYTERDLPYALDLENNCVVGTTANCKKYASKKLITLWAKTFLATVKEKTGRTPILYSYPSFLEGAMVRDDELRQYPLWLAQYGIDPKDPLAQPGIKPGGCFVHSWTTANCSSTWTVWQYTSCGIAPKYGVPGSRLDLNIFRGEVDAFLNLIKGTWIPEPADQMPKNELSQIVLKALKSTTADKSTTALVDVFRPDGKPVVTGTVRFYPSPLNPISPAPKQVVERASSGSWKLSIKGIPAGTWQGEVGFVDATGTHAQSRVPVSLVIAPAPEVTQTPTPTATPKPSPTKKPVVDGCKNQIKN